MSDVKRIEGEAVCETCQGPATHVIRARSLSPKPMLEEPICQECLAALRAALYEDDDE